MLKDYARCNPVTMNKALKQWSDLLAEKETTLRKNTMLSDEAIKLSKITKLKLKIENLE